MVKYIILNWSILSIPKQLTADRCIELHRLLAHLEERMQHSIVCSLPGFKVLTIKEVKFIHPETS